MPSLNLSRRSTAKTLPPSVGGLNDRDAITGMKPEYALQLDNFFPGTNDCSVRGGSSEHVNGLPAVAETLMGYNGPTSSSLFAVASGNIYDITTAGAVGSALVSGLSNSRWDFVNFGGAAGNFIASVNGFDLPRFYNGTSWTASGTGYATAITGATASNFSQVNVWKNRLFFVEKNTLKCWYLGVQAIGGAATAIDFSGVAKLGGKLIATATVSSTAGNTPDDYFIAITSEGECLVYGGTDPASATTFAIVGNFRIGRPIANGTDNMGGRFLVRIGNNTIAITVDGFVNLADALNSDVQAQRTILNDMIVNSVSSEVTKYKGNFGWQAILAPNRNKLLINVPTSEGSKAHQFVMNTITGAWTRFVGWNIVSMAYFNDELYGSIGTKIYKLDQPGTNDFTATGVSGKPIEAYARTAYHYFGGRNANKHFKMARPLLFSASELLPEINVDVDFELSATLGSSESLPATGALWGSAIWGTSLWASGSSATREWLSVESIGYCASLNMKLTVEAQTASWQGYDIIYETGGLI